MGMRSMDISFTPLKTFLETGKRGAEGGRLIASPPFTPRSRPKSNSLFNHISPGASWQSQIRDHLALIECDRQEDQQKATKKTENEKTLAFRDSSLFPLFSPVIYSALRFFQELLGRKALTTDSWVVRKGPSRRSMQ